MTDYVIVWSGTMDRAGLCPSLLDDYPRQSTLAPMAASARAQRGHADRLLSRQQQTFDQAKRDIGLWATV